MNAKNGDKYLVEIVRFTKPTESEMNEVLEQYGSFGQETFASKITEIINQDVFQSVRINLDNVIF